MNQPTTDPRIRPDIQPGDNYEMREGPHCVIDVLEREGNTLTIRWNGERMARPARVMGKVIDRFGYVLG